MMVFSSPRSVISLSVVFLSMILSTTYAVESPPHPHIIHIVADDLGRNDLGFRNGNITTTPHLNHLVHRGIVLDEFYTFKICSPSRAAMLSGRYPWGIGWYDMSSEANRCLAKNYTLLPSLLKTQGYMSHAIGKWDVGYILPECTASDAGFESFHGYYEAALQDYWYHGIGSQTCLVHYNATGTDLSASVGKSINGWTGVNGTYDADIFTQAAVDIISNHDSSVPLHLYLAYQNVHMAGGNPIDNLGVQSPCSTVNNLYKRIRNDSMKTHGGSITELDRNIGKLVSTLQQYGLWNDTIIVFNSDNGGPLTHARNAPLRGGKHTFWEGGVRVEAFISGPKVPIPRRGTKYDGIIHSSDFYPTFVEGIAGGTIPKNTGPRQVDGINVWNAVMNGNPSPRNEVIHQVNNSHFTENVESIRRGQYKLIRGNPGDNRVMGWKEETANEDVQFGRSGGRRETGTNNCRAPHDPEPKTNTKCGPPNYCLFDVVADPSETNNLSGHPQYKTLIEQLSQRLDEAGRQAMPPYYYFPDQKDFAAAIKEMCGGVKRRGFLEPVGVY